MHTYTFSPTPKKEGQSGNGIKTIRGGGALLLYQSKQGWGCQVLLRVWKRILEIYQRNTKELRIDTRTRYLQNQ